MRRDPRCESTMATGRARPLLWLPSLILHRVSHARPPALHANTAGADVFHQGDRAASGARRSSGAGSGRPGQEYGVRLHPTRGGLWPTFKAGHKCRRITLAAIERHKRHRAKLHGEPEPAATVWSEAPPRKSLSNFLPDFEHCTTVHRTARPARNRTRLGVDDRRSGPHGGQIHGGKLSANQCVARLRGSGPRRGDERAPSGQRPLYQHQLGARCLSPLRCANRDRKQRLGRDCMDVARPPSSGCATRSAKCPYVAADRGRRDDRQGLAADRCAHCPDRTQPCCQSREPQRMAGLPAPCATGYRGRKPSQKAGVIELQSGPVER